MANVYYKYISLIYFVYTRVFITEMNASLFRSSERNCLLLSPFRREEDAGLELTYTFPHSTIFLPKLVFWFVRQSERF